VYVSVVKVTPDSMKLMKLRMGIISRKDNLLPVNEGVTVETATYIDSKLSLREIIPIRSFINFMLSGVTFTTET
ncbi:hypothetical protein MJI65_24145, partial [Salmonella enterica subsp. enterica serovar Anatum]|nr:hypothetical protein [Salmonella enterica subsp. enterica serovar Anatum]